MNEGPVAAVVKGSLADQIYHVGFMWAFYLVPAALWLACIRLAGPNTWARVILAGALVGWSIEGAMVPAVYEAPPFSYIWTSVAWHAFVDVAFGLVLLPMCLSHDGTRRSYVMSVLAIALLWPVWSTWTWVDGPAAMISPVEFLTMAFWVLGLLGVGLAAYSWGVGAAAVMPKNVAWVLVFPSVVLFALNAIPYWLFALPLVVLIALTVWALGKRSSDPMLAGYVSITRLAGMLGLLVLAIPIYWSLFVVQISPEPELMLGVALILGTLGFVWALWRGFTHH